MIKGLIWRILNHPDGFAGEVVVAENVQDIGEQNFADRTPANAQDQNQSLTDVITVFQGLGRPVSLQELDRAQCHPSSGRQFWSRAGQL